ncbi:MAG: acetamidase [Oscillochloris sp.]|nr:acetamidase [Oscillochloris sp.]
MAVHRIAPSLETMRGYFSAEVPPVITIDPGDTLLLQTLDAGWGLEPPHPDGTPRRSISQPQDAPLEGHAMIGPIAVRGAKPGMALEIRIEQLSPGPYGYTIGGGFATALNQRLGVADEGRSVLRWELDHELMQARNQFGLAVPMRPFMGVIGMPPPEPGAHPSWPPRAWGGNIDCRELVAGSTLWLPVPVAGAYLFVGDGHAAQGDGEVSGTAIECPMDEVRLTITLREDLALRMPMAETAIGRITFGIHEDLNEAVGLALSGMIDLIEREYNLERKQALAMASVSVDLRITQLVNSVVGVHAVLPHNAIRKLDC